MSASSGRYVGAGRLSVGFEHALVSAGDVALDHLYRLAPLAPLEDLEELEMVFQPCLGKVMSQGTAVDQVEKDLGAQRPPSLVKPPVVGRLEEGVVKGDVEPGHRRAGQRARELVELLPYGGHTLEVLLGGVDAEPLGSQRLERRAQAVDLVDLVEAQVRHCRPPV